MKLVDDRFHIKIGDVLKIQLPSPINKELVVKAIPAKKDSDFCYGCCFYSLCRKFVGNGPIGSHCYSAIFEVCEDKDF